MKNIVNFLSLKRVTIIVFAYCFSAFILINEAGAQMIAPTMVQYRSPKSPNVDRLQTYLEVPTDLNTGQLAMTVPLYDIKLGGLTIPISLDYSNTGFKVKEIPSWVGMGWNLNVGGIITRTVRGLPDDLPNAGIMSQYPRVASCLDNTISNINRYQFYREIADGEVDSQFDEYTFTFLRRTGKFYINKNGVVVGLPKNNLKITFTNSSGIQNFTIVDESGISFVFGIREESASVSSDENLFGKGYYNWQTGVSWYLTKIVLPNSQEILFEYESYSLTYHQYLESLALERQGPEQCKPSVGMSAYQLALFDVSTPENHIKKITWPLGRVEFIPGPYRQDLKELNTAINSPSLNGIRVYNSDNELKKNINFGMINGNRLLLKAVNFLNTFSNTPESGYQFNYYNESSTWPSLSNASATRNAQDIWGYFNGAEQNSMLPFFTVGAYLAPGSYSFGGYGQTVDRSPNANFAIWGMLKEVIYPTGGKSVFEYEPNQATYPDYNSIPELLKTFVSMTYQTVLEDQVNTDGNSITNQSNTKPLTLASNVTRARIVTVETTNDQTGFANTSSSIVTYPGIENPNDCNCGHVTTTTNPYSHTYTREYYKDLPSGNYQSGVSASSYDGYTASAYIRIEVPVAQSYTANLGGLRIKKMYFNDGVSGVQMVKKYLYDFEGADMVNIKHFPTFVNTIVMNYRATGCLNCCLPCAQPMATLHSISVSPTPGYHLEYPKVIELSGENGENGRIVHKFTNTPYIGGFTSKPYADPATLNWYGGKEYKKEIQKNVSLATFTTIKEDNKNFDGEDFANYNSFDMSLKVAVKEVDYCAGYPAILFPNSNNEAATLVASAFAAEFVPVYTENFNLVNASTVDYFQASSNQVTNATNLSYTGVNKLLPSISQSVGSKGESVKVVARYAEDYTIPNNVTLSDEVKGLQLLKTKNMLSSPVERLNTIKNAGGVEMITSGELFEYYPNSPLIRRKYILTISAPLAESAFQHSSVNSAGNLIKDARYVLDYEVGAYDAFDNPSEIHSKDGLVRSVLWGYAHSQPVCEVTNAPITQIAYTSFESSEQGNFQYAGSIASSSASVTGKKYYNLTTANPLTVAVLPNEKYILSYWSNTSGGFSISGASTISDLPGRSFSTWFYHEHELTAQGTTITISGTGALDEVRLFPVQSQMVTFSYDPLYGMTSKCDVNGSITYYEYDGQGRLALIRDQDKNIIKQYSYQVSNIGSTDPQAAPDWQPTGATRCKPCELNNNYPSNIGQTEEKDMNPQSYFYQQTRWVDGEVNNECETSVIEDTDAPIRCYQTEEEGISTFKQRRDVNPCSDNYGRFYYVNISHGETSCPNNYIYLTGGDFYDDITATLVGPQGSFTFNVNHLDPQRFDHLVIIPAGIYTLNLNLPEISEGIYYHIRIGNKLIITSGGPISISNAVISSVYSTFQIIKGRYVISHEFYGIMIWNKKYKIVDYYSDTENLWSTVPSWVKDDVYTFSDSEPGWVDVKNQKQPGDNRDGWSFDSHLYSSNDIVLLGGIDLEYNPVMFEPEYYVIDEYFIVSYIKNGVKVYIKYEQVLE